jgi:hypothetical protein
MGIRGVLFMAKTTQYTYNTLLMLSQKYIELHNISFETWRGITLPCLNIKGK